MNTKEISEMSNIEYMQWVVKDWNNLIANLKEKEKDKQKELNKKEEADTNANS